MQNSEKMGDQKPDYLIIFHGHNKQVFFQKKTSRFLGLKLRSKDRRFFSELGSPLRSPFFMASFFGEKICWFN